MPQFQNELAAVCRSQVYHDWEGSEKKTTCVIFVDGEKEELVISHNMKTRVTSIRLGKTETKVRGKKLTDKELFP